MQRTGKLHTNRTIRRPYSRSKRFDETCRSHGACNYCRDARLHSLVRDATAADESIREFAVDMANSGRVH